MIALQKSTIFFIAKLALIFVVFFSLGHFFLGNKENAVINTTNLNDVCLFYAVTKNLSCPSLVYYTREEVARHASADDLWLVINGSVLDVSSFVPYHPGGMLILEAAGGNDAAALFSQHHLPRTVALLEKYCIGQIKE